MKISINPENPIFKFLEKVFDLMVANVLFIICSIPVFTFGASVVALNKIAQDVAMDKDKGVIKRFFDAFKENFKQSTVVWLMILIFGICMVANYLLITTFLQGFVAQICKIIIGVLVAVVVAIAAYIFPLMARYKNNIKEYYKNSLILIVIKLPRTLGMMILNTLFFWIPYFSMNLFVSTFVFWLVIGFAFVAYMDSEILLPVFRQLEPNEEIEEIEDVEDNN